MFDLDEYSHSVNILNSFEKKKTMTNVLQEDCFQLHPYQWHEAACFLRAAQLAGTRLDAWYFIVGISSM